MKLTSNIAQSVDVVFWKPNWDLLMTLRLSKKVKSQSCYISLLVCLLQQSVFHLINIFIKRTKNVLYKNNIFINYRKHFGEYLHKNDLYYFEYFYINCASRWWKVDISRWLFDKFNQVSSMQYSHIKWKDGNSGHRRLETTHLRTIFCSTQLAFHHVGWSHFQSHYTNALY